MRFGCIASLALWLALVSLLTGSLIPLALGAVFYGFLIVYRGLSSEWPLY
jgi:hypothetical protein